MACAIAVTAFVDKPSFAILALLFLCVCVLCVNVF